MGCCGSRRRAAAWSSMTGGVRSVTRTASVSPQPTVALIYTGDAPVVLNGPVSGRQYRIDASASPVAADPRDVRALMATGRFARS